ncbi:hypothetical protein DBV05_g12380 [Lasiodiplodia theobromae]|uniref:Peptidase A1 domain-containing protein n=1 Tax=Lasiodiplodia theobromae TaxID=45133 RepID=A0A5N5CUB6_9PEZI|nr:hypothetical protein DBV05_g12380 [Lasiodiplodia theobromae]
MYWLHVDEDLGYEKANGNFGFDQVGLDYLGAGGTIEHQVIATIAYEGFWFGAFPLNPRPFNFTDMNAPQTSFLQSLKDNNNISSLSWGYTAGAKYRSDNFFGSLVLGGYDKARFDNKSQITVDFNADDEKDLTIRVNNISTSTSSDLLTSESLDYVIDSTVPYLYLPESSYKLFEKNFGLEWNSSVGLYLVNDTHYDDLVKQDAEITFNVGTTHTTKIVFPIKAFLLTAGFPLISDGSTSRYFPIKRANESMTLTLGRAFLQESYVVYDYERRRFTLAPCTWPTDTATSPPSSPTIIYSVNTTEPDGSSDPNGSSSGLSTGALIGAVIGGVVAGLLIATLIACIWLRRRRRRRRSQRDSISKAGSSTIFPPHTRTSSSVTLPTTNTSTRPRAGSRLTSWLFRNPWSDGEGSMGSGMGSPYGGAEMQVIPGHFELSVDPSAPTPAEQAAGEHKRHLSNELDAEVCAVHEMYQPKQVVPEMQGDEPFPTYVSGDGATIEGNVLRAAQMEAVRERDEALEEEERRRLLEGRPGAGVYEMDASAAARGFPPLASSSSSSSGVVPRRPEESPMPSPGQLDAVGRKAREEQQRLEAERAEAERVRQSGGRGGNGLGLIEGVEGMSPPLLPAAATAPNSAAVGRPGTERRVSDLSPISEDSAFVTPSPTSTFRPDAGSRRVSRD